MGWSSSGPRKIHHYSAAIQDNTALARTKIQLTWDGSNPGLTVKSQQKHYPPPQPLSRDELEVCRERYGLIVHPNLRKCANRSRYSDKVATWCESNMGYKVGVGECWNLVHEACHRSTMHIPPARTVHGASISHPWPHPLLLHPCKVSIPGT
jgi:hypothetical protein